MEGFTPLTTLRKQGIQIGSPTIFSGSFTKFLTSKGALLSDGSIINNDGPINYIKNGTAEVNTTGWATYADAAQNIPVDGTGGTATNLTFSRSTSSPLYNSASFSMVQANSTSLQGKGVSYDFTINSGDQAKVLSVQFGFNASSTFIAANGTTAPLNDGTTTTNAGNSDIEVFIYDVTNAVLIPVSPEVITANGANNFVFKGVFQTASNSTSYRLIFHVATTSANATGWTFKYDQVYVGAQNMVQGSPVTDWQSYTMTITGTTSNPTKGTTTTDLARWRRVGDSMEIRYDYVQTSAGSAGSGDYLYSLPSGYTIDTAKLPMATNGTSVVGTGRLDNSTQAERPVAACAYNSTNLGMWVLGANTSDSSFQSSTVVAPLNQTNVLLSFQALVPISGWSSTVQMSNDTDTRVVAASYYVSANFASSTTTPINYDTKVFDTHAAVTTSATAWKFTAPVAGFYKVNCAVAPTSGSHYYFIYKNGSCFYFVAAEAAATYGAGGTIVQLVAGDYIDVRPNSATTENGGNPNNGTSANLTTITIERLTGPSAIAASESVNARYYASATSLSGSLATISWTTKDFDSHNAMSAGTFTCPSAGKYQVNAALAISGTFLLNNQIDMQLQKNGTAVSEALEYDGGAVTQSIIQLSDMVNCLAGDTIRIQVSSQGTSPAIVSSNTRNYFSIFRAGN